MSDKDNVIEMGKVNRSMSIKGRDISTRACRHKQTAIDEVRKVVECKHCGQVFEPFEFIMMWATKETNLAYNITALAHERQELAKAVEDLKRQKRNLQQQVKRQKEKLTVL